MVIAREFLGRISYGTTSFPLPDHSSLGGCSIINYLLMTISGKEGAL